MIMTHFNIKSVSVSLQLHKSENSPDDSSKAAAAAASRMPPTLLSSRPKQRILLTKDTSLLSFKELTNLLPLKYLSWRKLIKACCSSFCFHFLANMYTRISFVLDKNWNFDLVGRNPEQALVE